MHCGQDQGSDGLCGVGILLRKPEAKINCTEWWDESHGNQNDFLGNVTKYGLKPFVLLTMCLFNLPHGPEKDKDMRFHQLKATEQMIFDTFTSEDCASFQLLTMQIIPEVEKIQGTGERMSAGEVWEFIKEHGFFEVQGHRTTLCRFLAWLRAAKRLLQRWHSYYWVVMVLCIELDFLQGSSFTKKIALKQNLVANAVGPEGEETTSSVVPSVDGKILRSCCQNAAVISMVLLEDDSNRRLMSVIYHVHSPLDTHQSESNTQCRSVEGNRKFLAEQANGGLMQLCYDTFDVLTSPAAIEDCGFIPDYSDVKDDWFMVQEAENEWASLMGSMDVSFAAAKQRRKMYIFGYPHFLVVIPFLDVIAGLGVLSDFRTSHTAWLWLKTKAKEPGVDILLKRSQFEILAVQQMVHVCELEKWENTTRLQEFLKAHFGGCFATQVVEDLFNVAKNAKQAKGSKLFRRPERSMAVMVGKEVLNKRHHYLVEDSQMPLPSKKSKLGPEAFGKTPVDPSIDLSGIVTTSQTPSWYSPGVASLGHPIADHSLIKAMYKAGSCGLLQFSALSCLADCYPFVFKKDGMKLKDNVWLYGLGHFHASCALVMEVEIKKAPNGCSVGNYVDWTAHKKNRANADAHFFMD